MNNQRRNAIRLFSGLCAAITVPSIARAQKAAYPNETVTMVVPFAAGGSTDYLARLLTADLNTRHAGKFIVDNRSGAGGIIGTKAVSGATPDGRTLLYTTATSFSVNPFIYKTLPYDPINGFAPIALTVQLPLVVAVSKELGIKTLQELVEYLRKNQERSSYSSYGSGTASHISAALFVKNIGAPGVLHVPYKDTRAIPDLAAGRNTFQIDAWSTVAPLVSSGKLVVLAGCGVERMPWAPGVPTVASVIGQDYDMFTWHAVFAPKATSPEILDLLSQEIKVTMAKDAVQKAAVDQGFKPYPYMSRKDVSAFVENDGNRWKRFIEIAGVERQ
jgi:tripartite-type tricarboxylate transporter receptor subunit TctC